MEWWLKAGLTIIGVSGAFTANHLWKEHYRKVTINKKCFVKAFCSLAWN
jgi:hypothetical protein